MTKQAIGYDEGRTDFAITYSEQVVLERIAKQFKTSSERVLNFAVYFLEAQLEGDAEMETVMREALGELTEPLKQRLRAIADYLVGADCRILTCAFVRVLGEAPALAVEYIQEREWEGDTYTQHGLYIVPPADERWVPRIYKRSYSEEKPMMFIYNGEIWYLASHNDTFSERYNPFGFFYQLMPAGTHLDIMNVEPIPVVVLETLEYGKED